jgi:hypothetical protein
VKYLVQQGDTSYDEFSTLKEALSHAADLYEKNSYNSILVYRNHRLGFRTVIVQFNSQWE